MSFKNLLVEGKPIVETTVVPFTITEPGHKIPIASYLQVGCWCEKCEDTTAQVVNVKLKKIRCLKCKNTRTIKVKES